MTPTLTLSLLSALLQTNAPTALQEWVQERTGVKVESALPADPIEAEFRRLMTSDDVAEAEIDQWIRDREELVEKGIAGDEAAFRGRIQKRLDAVRKEYEAFLSAHPDHVEGRLAFGGFLMDIKEPEAGEAEWEKARQLAPDNPSPWNNLANHYGHVGPILKAFEYYEKAISLDPKEPVYLRNLATTVFLFRKDAREFYKITEAEVFEKSLDLYRKALALEPSNFFYAADLAQTYYGIEPPKLDDPVAQRAATEKYYSEVLGAWEAALKLAADDTERQGVYVHLARVHINAGKFEEARKRLDAITVGMLQDMKRTLLRRLAREESRAIGEQRGAAPGGTPEAPEGDR